MSPPSPKALYHPIPQAPVASNPIPPPETDFDDDEVESPDHELRELSEPSADSRIRWIYFVLGCAVLLPWNVMITATPYFLSRLASSPFRSTFSSYMSTSFTASNFAFLAHATITSKQSSPSRQIITALICLSCLTLLLTLSTFVLLPSGIFFTFVLLNGIAQAGLGSYLQTSVIALASLFGPTAVQSMMSGQAAVAVVVSGVQVLSAATSVWSKPDDASTSTVTVADGSAEERSAFMFFGLSTLFLLAAVLAQRWLMTMPAYKIVAGTLEKRSARSDDTEESQELVSSGPTPVLMGKGQVLRVAKANLVYEIAVAYVFIVTLAVFPPITASVLPVNPSTHPLLFTATHFLVFAVGDLAGRYICSFPRFIIWSARRLLTLSLTRTLFIPLFLACNVQRPSETSISSPPIINSDFLFMFILLLFGLSNGYVSSLCMMSAPSLEHNPRLHGRQADVDVAATVASFCLVGGLAIGSVASFAVRGSVCECNPFAE